jgi:hypothetical protein
MLPASSQPGRRRSDAYGIKSPRACELFDRSKNPVPLRFDLKWYGHEGGMTQALVTDAIEKFIHAGYFDFAYPTGPNNNRNGKQRRLL